MSIVRPLIFIIAFFLPLFASAQNSSLCTGSLGDPIVNITFGGGDNPGQALSAIVPQASTTYSFVSVFGSPASPVPVDGDYTITNNIPGNSAWFGGAKDHTGNANGYMAFFNANPTPGEFYKQNVTNLCPGTVYQFSAWAANVLNANVMIGVRPNITFRIEKTDGTLVASYVTGDIDQSFTMSWQQYGFFFTAPSDGSSLVLKMTNTNVGGNAQPGNDFAIDDITFRACGPESGASFDKNISQTLLNISPASPFTLYGSVNPLSNSYDYLWQQSSDGGTSWKDVNNSTQLSLPQTSLANNGSQTLYRMLNAEKGNINSANCRTTSNVVTLTVSSAGSGSGVPCNNWLKVGDNNSGVTVGDLDIPGQKMTVEATFNRTQTYFGGRLYAGDIVSKHSGPNTTNYLLRPNSAEITTTNGYFITPEICDADLNKTYHVAMVYDGNTLKFYRDGFLMSQISCSGDLYQNDFLTTFGAKASEPYITPDESLRGYINEVRIWNVARTQDQIRQFMNASLPNPQTQTGLAGYYTFNDLKNKQGNTQWNGSLFNDAQTNQTNSQCLFVADSCDKIVIPVVVNANFNAPDTVCINAPVNLVNTSVGATNNYWSFCATDLNTTSPEAVNLGNLNNAISWPVFMDLVHDGNNYYGFLVDHHPGSLIRLDFGNSLLNTPTSVNLGNFNGVLPLDYGAEGIQVVKNNGKWYAIIVGGSIQNNELPRIIKIDFGTDITNSSPTATNWGNIGNLSQPIDLYVFYESGNWYGFTPNGENNTITRFNFGSNFDQPPTGDNLGNINGVFNYPTGLYPVNDNGSWHLFVTNQNGNSLVRVDFGSSLLNAPTATNLGSAGNILNSPRDISIMKSCNSMVGYVVNGSPDVQELVKLDFHNNVLSAPTGTSLGNNGNYSFPHSISKLFRVGNDLYTFITNVYNNTITRLKFSGCNSSNIANYEGVNPPQISYSTPGIYNVLLSVDEGLPTQTTYCKQIVVLAKPLHQPNKDTTFCEGHSLKLARSYPNVTYLWNTGATDSFITVTTPGKYWVEFNKGYDCTATDTFVVKGSSNLVANLGVDTGLCNNQSLTLNAGNPGNTYLWQDGSTQQIFTATQAGSYHVKITSANSCFLLDTIQVNNYASPVINTLNNPKICSGDSIKLSVTTQENNDTFLWNPSATLSGTTISNPIAFPSDTTKYFITVTNSNGCKTLDSVVVFAVPKPSVQSIADTAVCINTSFILQSSVKNASSLQWTPATGLDNSQATSPLAKPASSITYIVTAVNDICKASDTVNINVIVPEIFAGNDTALCDKTTLQLNATGGVQYQWSPIEGLSNPNIANPIATFSKDVAYQLNCTDVNGCSDQDSIYIHYSSKPVFAISSSEATVCRGDTLLVKASGGDLYNWSPSGDILRPSQDSVEIIANTTTTYSVSITNFICKVSDEKTIAVSVLPSPDISIRQSNEIDCSKDSAVLTASGGISYAWSPANSLSNPNEAVTVANPETDMLYKVKVTDANGCTSTDTIYLSVLKGGENKFGLPTAFTPNGDGLNDCFGVKTWKYIKLLDFSIFDRWGKLLFHTNKVSDCWDGMYKGNYEPVGAYVCQVHAETDCGVISKNGTFVLIR